MINMAIYAIINNNNRVTNLVVSSASFAAGKDKWILVEGTQPNIGDSYNAATKMFEKPAPNVQKARRDIKQTVRELLRRTDWTQVPDNLNATKQAEWKAWRQSLRELIMQAQTDPFNIVFPTPPGDLDEDGL